MSGLDDTKKIEDVVYKAVADALEQVVFPKFDNIDKKFENIDNRFNKIDERFNKIDDRFNMIDEKFSVVDEKLDNLTKAVEILDSDMGGVKMRLKIVENKLDGLIDTTFIVKDHEKRITRLEKLQPNLR